MISSISHFNILCQEKGIELKMYACDVYSELVAFLRARHLLYPFLWNRLYHVLSFSKDLWRKKFLKFWKFFKIFQFYHFFPKVQKRTRSNRRQTHCDFIFTSSRPPARQRAFAGFIISIKTNVRFVWWTRIFFRVPVLSISLVVFKIWPFILSLIR